MVLLNIAVRNAVRQSKRSLLLAGAIAFGVMVITLLNAFTAGVVENIKVNMAYAFGGHIFISGSELSETGRVVGRISEPERLEQTLANADVTLASMHRRSRAMATVIFGARQATERIDGVNFRVETELAKGLPLRAGSLEQLGTEPQAILLTGLTAEKLGVVVGEQVLVRLTTVNGQQNVGEFLVVGVVEDGGNLGLASAYADLSTLNALLGLGPDEYQMLNLVLDDIRAVNPAADALVQQSRNDGLNVVRPLQEISSDPLEAQLQGQEAVGQLFGQTFSTSTDETWEGTKFQVTTLNEILEPVESALVVLDAIAMGIFLILLVITMVGILNTFRMILIERTREIGTMRAFGMQRAAVRRIFLLEAAVIALGGGAIGIGLAGVVAAVVSQISFAHLPQLQFFTDNGHFTFWLTPGDAVSNLIILLVMSLLAAFFPANAAARLRPAKALGAHF